MTSFAPGAILDFDPAERAYNALVHKLTDARTTFQRYGDLHASKTPPTADTLAKAKANYDQVAEINQTLVHATEMWGHHKKTSGDLT